MAETSGPVRKPRDERESNVVRMPGVKAPRHAASEELAEARARGSARIITASSWTAAGAVVAFGIMTTALAAMTVINGGKFPVGATEAGVSGFIHGLILLYTSALFLATTIAVVALTLAAAYWLIPHARRRNG